MALSMEKLSAPELIINLPTRKTTLTSEGMIAYVGDRPRLLQAVFQPAMHIQGVDIF